jgi:hypothetical protein
MSLPNPVGPAGTLRRVGNKLKKYPCAHGLFLLTYTPVD